MAQSFLTKTQRRDLHIASGQMHPKCVARQTRERKRGHRRLTRRESARQTPRTPVEPERNALLIEQDEPFEDEY